MKLHNMKAVRATSEGLLDPDGKLTAFDVAKAGAKPESPPHQYFGCQSLPRSTGHGGDRERHRNAGRGQATAQVGVGLATNTVCRPSVH